MYTALGHSSCKPFSHSTLCCTITICLYRMAEKNEYVLCVPVELIRRFKGLSIDAGKPCTPVDF